MESTQGNNGVGGEDAKIEARGSCSVNQPDYRIKGAEDMSLSEDEEKKNRDEEKEVPHETLQGLQESCVLMNGQIMDLKNEVRALWNRTTMQLSSLSSDIRTLEEILRILAPLGVLQSLPTLPDVDPELEELESEEDGWTSVYGQDDGSESVSGQNEGGSHEG